MKKITLSGGDFGGVEIEINKAELEEFEYQGFLYRVQGDQGIFLGIAQ